MTRETGGDIWLTGVDALYRHSGDDWEVQLLAGREAIELIRADAVVKGSLWTLEVGADHPFDLGHMGRDSGTLDSLPVPGDGGPYEGFDGFFVAGPNGGLWRSTECDGVRGRGATCAASASTRWTWPQMGASGSKLAHPTAGNRTPSTRTSSPPRPWRSRSSCLEPVVYGRVTARDSGHARTDAKHLRLTHPALDFWVDVTVHERAGRYMATADLAEDSRDVGVGDTPQEAIRAAL